jgi:hypothetical protein
MFVEIEEVVGVDIHKPIVRKQLAQDIPSLLKTLTVIRTLRRCGNLMAVAI